ncbi:hypothetical protein [Lentzea sp. NBRC 102530]|uniref:hypothetical protein n=1 Tax=Lentzea sp. NBRC 102530 TaxID=3032201 RepID=UPI0024A2A286|nr:hypothetical protein [Lentzea sp. NBRC 102530]GLY55194.1 hypothetical protein Lesp01_88490 [Lentzea sp. NBRC 102530]
MSAPDRLNSVPTDCLICARPGRLRPAPFGAEQLVVCDFHWWEHDGPVAHGPDAVDDFVPVAEDPNPVADYRAEARVWHDELGLWDRTLVHAGVRWERLRWLPRTVRKTLYDATVTRTAPAGTRACNEGAEVWLDEFERCVMRETFQDRKVTKLRAIALRFVASVDRAGRPITRGGVTQDELAELLGCTARYVRELLGWFYERGLLAVVVGGTTSTAVLDRPVDEHPDEATARERREDLLQQARRQRREEAIAHRKAVLAAKAAGLPAPPLPDSFAPFRAVAEQDDALPPPQRVIHIGQVYELRVPEGPESTDPAYPRGNPDELAAARQRRSERQREAIERLRAGALPDELNPLRPASSVKSSSPSVLDKKEEQFPVPSGVVDERRPSGGSYEKGFRGVPGGPNQSGSRAARPVRAARRLLGLPQHGEATMSGGVLPDQLRRGLTMSNLARLIREHVLAGWTDAELVAAIAYDGGRKPSIGGVGNAGGWTRAALRLWPATGDRPNGNTAVAAAAARAEFASVEDLRDAVDHVERYNARRHDERHRRAHRIAIDACSRCDAEGWTPLDGNPDVVVRCDHVPADDEDQAVAPDEATPAADGKAAVQEQLAAAAARREEQRKRLVDEAKAHKATRHAEPETGTRYRPTRRRRRSYWCS